MMDADLIGIAVIFAGWIVFAGLCRLSASIDRHGLRVSRSYEENET